MKETLILILILFLSACAAANKEAYPAGDVASVSESSKTSAGLPSKHLKKQTKRILSYEGYVYLAVPSEDKEKIIEEVSDYVRKQKGFVYSQTKQSLTFKVPSKYFRKTLAYLKTKGDVSEENIKIIDITDSYYDTKIRLENSENLQKRLIELLKRAKNVSEAVEVERELSRVTQDIETLKAAMRRYKGQMEYSSVSVYFQNATMPGPLGWVFYGFFSAVKWLFVWD